MYKHGSRVIGKNQWTNLKVPKVSAASCKSEFQNPSFRMLEINFGGVANKFSGGVKFGQRED